MLTVRPAQCRTVCPNLSLFASLPLGCSRADKYRAEHHWPMQRQRLLLRNYSATKQRPGWVAKVTTWRVDANGDFSVTEVWPASLRCASIWTRVAQRRSSSRKRPTGPYAHWHG